MQMLFVGIHYILMYDLNLLGKKAPESWGKFSQIKMVGLLYNCNLLRIQYVIPF